MSVPRTHSWRSRHGLDVLVQFIRLLILQALLAVYSSMYHYCQISHSSHSIAYISDYNPAYVALLDALYALTEALSGLTVQEACRVQDLW